MKNVRLVDVLPIGIAVALFVLTMVMLPDRGDARPAPAPAGQIGLEAAR